MKILAKFYANFQKSEYFKEFYAAITLAENMLWDDHDVISIRFDGALQDGIKFLPIFL